MKKYEPSSVVDRTITWSLSRPIAPLPSYAISTVAIVAVAIGRALLVTNLLPWLLFVPVILILGLLLGKGPGVYATLLSALLVALTIGRPGAPFWLDGQQWAATAVFALVSISVVMIAAELRAAFRRLAAQSAEQARTNALLIEQDEQLRLLNGELGHRIKNLLTIVGAVAAQTLRQASDLKTANDALASRLAALGKATEFLTASDWGSADLHALARAAFDTHGCHGSRCHYEGPAIRFNSQVTLALALALHELVTNATKYGALSNDVGHVDLSWAILPGPNGGEPRFSLTWQERGGPEVHAPTRRGFGSLMIERSLRSYFRGDTAITFDPAGVVFRIDAPLAGAGVEGK